MRLGALLIIIGLLVTGAGFIMSDGHTETTQTWNGYYYETHETFEPNPLKPIVMFIGGLLFSGGWGGWIGTYDADKRRERAAARGGPNTPPEPENPPHPKWGA